MKPYQLSKSSLHYRLAKTYGQLQLRYSDEHQEYIYNGDICEYIRALLFGLLLILCIIIGVSVITIPLLEVLFAIYVYFTGSLSNLSVSMMSTLGLGIILWMVILVLGVCFGCYKINERRQKNPRA